MKAGIYLSIIATSCLVNGFAQTKAEELGVKEFNGFDYYASIDKLESVPSKDAGVMRKLAEGYDKTGNYQKAEYYYSQVCTRADRIPNDHLCYARLLMKNEKYAEAEAQMKIYGDLNPENAELARFNLLNESLKEYSKKGAATTVTNLSINSEQEDFAAIVEDNVMYFASSRTEKNVVGRKWVGNRLPFLDVYTASVSGNQVGELMPLDSKAINKKYHEGPITFSPKGDELFITRTNYDATAIDGTRQLSLLVSHKNGMEWSEPELLPFNSDDYSVGHAALSPDGNTLYFASDMPGGKGGVDIYRSMRSGGTWSVPENITNINTIGDEMFPYIHESGLFFYSSNGSPGYGGLDVFVGEYKDHSIKQVRNVGAPFNSSHDDFSVWLAANGTEGYFSSNRTGGKGDDDIYAVKLDKPFSFGRKLHVIVKDEKGVPVENAQVVFVGKDGVAIEEHLSAVDGTIEISTDKIGDFSLIGSKTDYFNSEKTFAISENDPDELQQVVVIEKDPGFQLLTKVTDKKSNTPIDSVKVTLTNNFTGTTDVFYTNNAGELLRGIYDRKIGDRVSYNIRLEKQGYLSKGTTYNKQLDKPGVYDVSKDLNLTLEKMDVGVDLAKAIDLKPIYFDVNKYEIRPDAAIELDKIVKVMTENPTMVVELGSHTDCRGTAAKNLELSQKRAAASAAYIKARITNPDRIYGMGYGETKILNGCTCEGNTKVKYTEQQHAVNRRTEFLIVKI